jgi:hypothetical protein
MTIALSAPISLPFGLIPIVAVPQSAILICPVLAYLLLPTTVSFALFKMSSQNSSGGTVGTAAALTPMPDERDRASSASSEIDDRSGAGCQRAMPGCGGRQTCLARIRSISYGVRIRFGAERVEGSEEAGIPTVEKTLPY